MDSAEFVIPEKARRAANVGNKAVPTVLAAGAEKMRRSMHAYVRGSWEVLEPGRRFVDNWHIGYISEHLEAMKRRELKFVVFNVPPGSMKSLIINVNFPSWVWVDAPHERFLCLGASDDLPTRDSLKCRRVIESAWYRGRWGDKFKLLGDANVKTRYENDCSGSRAIGSFAGSILGERAGFILVDDPHKTDLAESDTVREGKLIKFREEVYTRREDEHSVIGIIMQRLNDRDLSGYVLSEGWADAHVCIPMRFEPDRRYSLPAYPVRPENQDPRKAEGELMCPERFPEHEVQKLEKVLGSFGSAGQLQQRPSPRGGGIVKRADFEKAYYRQADLPGLMARFELIYDTWDMAFKDTADSSYVVGQKWGRIGTHKYCLRQVRERMSFTKSLQAVKDLRDHGPMPHGILIEDKANGPAIIDTLRQNVSGIIAIEPLGSKIARAEAAAPQIEAGEVHLPNPDEPEGAWAETVISEWCAVPGNAFWDQVDASGQVLLKMRGSISSDDFKSGSIVGDELQTSSDYLGGLGIAA